MSGQAPPSGAGGQSGIGGSEEQQRQQQQLAMAELLMSHLAQQQQQQQQQQHEQQQVGNVNANAVAPHPPASSSAHAMLTSMAQEAVAARGQQQLQQAQATAAASQAHTASAIDTRAQVIMAEALAAQTRDMQRQQQQQQQQHLAQMDMSQRAIRMRTEAMEQQARMVQQQQQQQQARVLQPQDIPLPPVPPVPPVQVVHRNYPPRSYAAVGEPLLPPPAALGFPTQQQHPPPPPAVQVPGEFHAVLGMPLALPPGEAPLPAPTAAAAAVDPAANLSAAQQQEICDQLQARTAEIQAEIRRKEEEIAQRQADLVKDVAMGSTETDMQQQQSKERRDVQQTPIEAKKRQDGVDAAVQTTTSELPRKKTPTPGSKLKRRIRNRPKGEDKTTVSNQTVAEAPSRGTGKRKAIEEAEESVAETNKRQATDGGDEMGPELETTMPSEAPIVPTNNDIICGRSKAAHSHPGNEPFRLLCIRRSPSFYAADREGRNRIVASVIDEVRNLDPPGRFLDYKDGGWYLLGHKDVVERVTSRLRDAKKTKGGPARRSKGGKEVDTRGPQSLQRQKGTASKRGEDSNELSVKDTSMAELEHPPSNKIASSIDWNEDVGDAKKEYDMSNSYSFLRYSISTCRRAAVEGKIAIAKTEKKRKREAGKDALLFYPEAPLGQIWIDATSETGKDSQWKVGLDNPPPLDSGGTILGRNWIWDEGQYADENDMMKLVDWKSKQKALQDDGATANMPFKELVESALNDTKSLPTSELNEPAISTSVVNLPSSSNAYVPPHLRAYCLCGGVDHDDFRPSAGSEASSMTTATPGVASSTSARKRRSGRQGSSIALSNVLGELAKGILNPHTLVSCEAYKGGPELRFLHDDAFIEEEYSVSPLPSPTKPPPTFETSSRAQPSLSDLVTASRLKHDQVQPFAIKVCPDAMFLADLQSHLSDSEVIGFLGGRYVESERCIYVQAAFPCKSASSGSTDVEMDPVSQIIAGETIVKHGLEVVGWYHSHPTFQPDPSVTDIHNQRNYQQLFGDHGHAVEVNETDEKKAIPFVGLIVGTWDAKNPTAESVTRWFHVTPKETGNISSGIDDGIGSKRSLSRGSSFVGAPSLTTEKGWLKERVFFPMDLQVIHRKSRHFGDIGSDDGSGAADADNARLRQEMTAKSTSYRRQVDSRRFLCALSQRQPRSLTPIKNSTGSAMFCQPIQNQAMKAASEKAGASLELGSSTREQIKDFGGKNNKVKEGSPLMIDDILPVNVEEPSIKPIHPLLFNDQELAILRLVGDGDSATDLIHAGVIWYAVEREQLMATEDKEMVSAAAMQPQPPPSSNSILDLLLHLPQGGTSGESSAVSTDGSPRDLLQDDAVLIHTIDVVLSHYSADSHRIDPFGTWTGSGDKGQVDSKAFRSSLKAAGAIEEEGKEEKPSDLERYYLEVIMGISQSSGDTASGKMRRGHKICACLLRWSRSLQLLPYQWSEVGHCSDNKPAWDHEATTQLRKPHIFFVAEIMRLMAARWREADAAGLSGRRKRRGRTHTSSGTPNVDRKASGEVDPEEEKDVGPTWTCHLCGREESIEKKRCGHCKAWKGGSRNKATGAGKRAVDNDDDEEESTHKERAEDKANLDDGTSHIEGNVCRNGTAIPLRQDADCVEAALRRGDIRGAVDPIPQHNDKNQLVCIVRGCCKLRRYGELGHMCRKHAADWKQSGKPLITEEDIMEALAAEYM